ncbi:MAG: hypothetical protein IKW04_01410 [Clostridia bacterium]|nr:hypothetical protein [Clostridia bacterium]
MDKFLRTLRIIAFIGLSYVFVYMFAYDIPFSYQFNLAMHPITPKDYFYSYAIGSLLAYPLLFVITVIYYWIHYGGVSLFMSSRDKVGLLQMFLQNEVQLPSNIIFKIHCNIFQHNSNWLGASFLGFNKSKGIIKALRRLIGGIAYIILPVVFYIFFIVGFALIYYGLLIYFKCL